MAISITVAAQNFDLTTLARVKDRLKIRSKSKDVRLKLMITGVSKSLTRKLGREFAKETVIETVKGYGTTNLVLSRSPIITINSILLDQTPVLDFTIEDSDSSILYRRAGWNWTVVGGFMGIGFNPRPNSEESLFRVDYEAGYVLPNWTLSDDRDLPEDIEDLVLDYIHFLYANRSQKDVSIRSYTIGNISVGKSTQNAVVDFMADFNRRCLDYKRIV